MKYFIVASGYNCLTYAQKCYESIKRIEFYGDWHAILISDGSTDGTNEYLEKEVSHLNMSTRTTKENMGAAFQRHQAINNANLNDDDVIIFIGLDDEIFKNALTRIDLEYKNGKWMTYGNWIDQHGHGLPKDFDLEFPASVHQNRSYRKVIYRSTGLNTFKHFLYKRIPEDDLKINGKWINSTTESEVMFSCLEMCGKDRIGIIRDYIALYNRNLPNGSINRLGKEYKYKLLDIIKSRPKRDLLK